MSETVKNELHRCLREIMEKEELWVEGMESELPRSWEKHGDMLLFSPSTLANSNWKKGGSRIWELICSALQAKRIARKMGPTGKDELRRPSVELLYGDDPWVTKKENGIIYSWDIRKCMFSSGNISEKLRISTWNCRGKVVVDLYAGIGYFTLSYLVHAKADKVYAVEKNPDAIEALKLNLQRNGVDSKCVIIAGDNAAVGPFDVADHVNLGFLPSTEKSWGAACRALRSTDGGGGILHIHGNVDTKVKAGERSSHTIPSDSPLIHYPEPWRQWARSVENGIRTAFRNLPDGNNWKTEIEFIHKVKNYGPHIDHLVLDLKCTPTSNCRVTIPFDEIIFQ